ncbi:DUF1963 domain-containing protein [Hyphomicrobium sp. xq]|uniref:DUF1963 domain-containing protein n=1 Tax=Hyphomicrobium album TaxID=2665159 RepID=A0A6I3KI62_9HYPH|nr:DUF1963 domain-containing protein [Hyphomicrobium album]MTD93412.1 DUF1963 domain-containing protein [Hyphomicrobium album]
MLSDKDLSLVAWLLEQHREPAVLLFSPFPPHAAPKVRSKIGGRPNLPGDCPWPMGRHRRQAVPLHFLAQIDCAELPRLSDRLPARGVLFFFGCDMDQDWSAKDPRDDTRVLYIERMPAETPDREPPQELPPLYEAYAAGDEIAAYGGLPGEEGPKIHVEWPLVATRIDTWPSAGAFQDIGGHFEKVFPHQSPADAWSMLAENRDEFHAASKQNGSIAEVYDERVRFKRLDAFVAATGTTNRQRAYHLGWEHSTGRRYDEPWRTDGVRFPQLGIMIDRLARHVVKEAQFLGEARGKDLGPEGKRHIHAIVGAALQWIDRAREIGPLGNPSDADGRALNAWLATIHGEQPFLPSAQPRVALNIETNRHVRAALIDTVNALATTAPEKFPARYYDALAADFTLLWSAGMPQLSQHQMLGHVASSQDAKAIDDPDICLLRLSSDPIRQMGFGDAGECTFWIKADDLAALSFDKAWGTIVGH